MARIQRAWRGLFLACLTAGSLVPSLHAAEPPAETGPADSGKPFEFKEQQIDRSLKIGYAVRIADINADGKPDIVVCDADRVIWFSNGDWKLHTVIENAKAGVTADNVCIAVADIDGDKKLDIALGADWQPNNTKAGGSLQWLKQPDDLNQPWRVFKIAESIPTLHRIQFGDLDGDGKPELLVGPLKGVGSTSAAAWADTALTLSAYKVPANPTQGPWLSTTITDRLHVMHNLLPVQWGLTPGEQLLTASYEGVNLFSPLPGGKFTMTTLGQGAALQGGNRGSSEIKFGRLADNRIILATIEPFHGNKAVVYVQPAGDAPPDQPWPSTVLDDSLTGGHAVWCADLDGDGNDEIVIGWRDVIAGKPPTGIRIFHTTGKAAAPAKADPQSATQPAATQATPPALGMPVWSMQQLDKGAIACEDLACADLDGDGRMDVIAVGRKTQNVKIYWNKTPQQKGK